MRTSEILAKLKGMAAKAGEAVYERTSLAAMALADDEWVAATFSGDQSKARDILEADYFPELSKAFGLYRLLMLFKTFPDKETWKQHKYNLMRLWAEHEAKAVAERGDKPKRTHTVRKQAEFEEIENKLKESQWREKSAREVVATKETELERISRENAQLKAENAELRGENKSLLRMIENMRQGTRERAVA